MCISYIYMHTYIRIYIYTCTAGNQWDSAVLFVARFAGQYLYVYERARMFGSLFISVRDVYVFICMNICIYLCILIYICLYIYLYMFVYIHTYKHKSAHIHMYVYVYVRVYRYIYTYV